MADSIERNKELLKDKELNNETRERVERWIKMQNKSLRERIQVAFAIKRISASQLGLMLYSMAKTG